MDVYKKEAGGMFEVACNGMGRSDVERWAVEAEKTLEEVSAHNDVLKKALKIALDENAVLNESLTRTQVRCTELKEEVRALRAAQTT